jgi:class 3 adenylate cyclase
MFIGGATQLECALAHSSEPFHRADWLCDEAKDGQILVSSRIADAVGMVAKLEDLGNLELRGLRRPVGAFNVVQSTSAAEARPNLTVVARGPEA